eukprot:scaffold293929_cov22-Tisochrysis_lutea.AAC.2
MLSASTNRSAGTIQMVLASTDRSAGTIQLVSASTENMNNVSTILRCCYMGTSLQVNAQTWMQEDSMISVSCAC